MVSKLGEGYFENNELVPTGKEEKEQYFYFQDHLGSSTYITDLNGDIAQYSAYTPYGEMFREYRNVVTTLSFVYARGSWSEGYHCPYTTKK